MIFLFIFLFPVGKTLCFLSIRESLLLLCSYHLTSIFIPPMISLYENPNRLCGYDTEIQICPRNIFFSSNYLYAAQAHFVLITSEKNVSHCEAIRLQFFYFKIYESGCTLYITVLCNDIGLEIFLQRPSRNRAQTTIFIIFTVSSFLFN